MIICSRQHASFHRFLNGLSLSIAGQLALSIFLFVLQGTAALAAGPPANCTNVRGSALVDPGFPPPGEEQQLVSSIGCKEFDDTGKVIGIWVQTTTGDGTANISNTFDVNVSLVTLTPTHPAILRATASPQFLQWIDAPAWGYVDNDPTKPIQLLVYSSGIAPTPRDYYSGPITIDNSGNLTTTSSALVPISARGSVSSVTVSNHGNILSTGGGVSAISAYTGVISPDRADGNGVTGFDWGAGDIYYPGGAISIINSGKIGITGNNGIGLLAKTLGGGINIGNSGAITIDGSNGAAIRAFAQSNSIDITNSAALTLQGDGSVGVDATMVLPGTVNVTNDGAIKITGYRGTGISVLNADAGETPGGATTRVKGHGAITVTGDDVTGIDALNRVGGSLSVDYSGKISVDGAHAVGIHAYTDEGADISVKANADITVSGASAIGIVVSGLGEGIANTDGTLTPLQHGNLSVEVANGVTVKGGSFGSEEGELARTAAGVAFVGGTANTLINRGAIAADSGLAVTAFEGSQSITDDQTGETINLRIRSGALEVQNYGTITGDIVSGSAGDKIVNHAGGVIDGNISLGSGANSFENQANGIVNSRDRIDVGSDYMPPNVETNNGFLNFNVGNTFTNFGNLSPGGVGKIQTTTIYGNYIQSIFGGRLLIDIDESAIQKSDFIKVTGAALLSGVVKPNEIYMGGVISSSYKVLHADRGVILDGASAPDTVGYDYGLEQRTDKDVYLNASKIGSISSMAAGAVAGAGPASGIDPINTKAVAAAITQFEDGGSAAGQQVGGDLRNLPDNPALNQALQRVTPQTGGQQSNSTNSGNTSFSNSMLSCASRDQPYRFTKEDTCYYAKFTARRLESDATSTSAGHDETGYEFIGGTQVSLGGNLRGGFAAGYEKTNSATQSLTQGLGKSDGDRVHAGIVLKDQWGPINAYFNIAGSYGWYDHTRFVNLGGFTNALGQQDVVSGLVKLRLSYLAEMGNAYIKPLVDFSATYVDLGGYAETGAGGFNLHVNSTDTWLFGASPALELGGELEDASGTLYRPYIRGGVTVYDKDNLTFTANFASAPVGVAGFAVTSALDHVFADVAAGVQVLTASGKNLKLEYEGRFGEHTSQNAGTVKVTVPY